MASSTSYLGTVPPARGTGPKNLPKTPQQAFNTGARSPRPAVRRAPTPRTGTARASSGYTPPAGGASGVPKPTSPLASANPRNVSRPRSSMRAKGQRLGKPRADFPSKI